MSTAVAEKPRTSTKKDELTVVAAVDQSDLLNALALIKKCYGRSKKFVTAVNMRFDASAIELWGAGGDALITTRIEDLVISSRGKGSNAMSVDVHRLYSLVREMPREELTISVAYSDQLPNGSWDKIRLTIEAGGFEYHLQCIEAYPPISIPEDAVVAARIPLVELGRTKPFISPFVSPDMLRPAMMNAHVDPEGIDGPCFVATNGHALGVDPILGENVEINAPTAISPFLLGILPRLRNDTVEILEGSHSIYYRCGSTFIDARTSSEKYPNWKAVIPDADAGRARIEAKPFAASMKRLRAAASRMTNQIVVEIREEGMRARVENVERDITGSEKIDAEITDFEIEIGFNCDLLRETIASIGDQFVEIDFTGPNRAAIVRGTESQRFCLVMPVMLNTYA